MTKEIDVGLIIESKESLSCILVNRKVSADERWEEIGHEVAYGLCCAGLNHFIHVHLPEILWTVAHQAPLSRGFSRQEYWNGLPCSHPNDLPNPGIEPVPLTSLALVDRFFTTHTTRETLPMD